MTGKALTGKVAIVTGGRRGIGRQTAVELARQGAAVVVAARGDASQTAAEVRSVGGAVAVVEGDLADADVRARLVEVALDTFGRVDVLVNNAAYTTGEGMNQSIDDLTMAEWERQFAVNVHVPMALIQAVTGHMRDVGGGVVINITSPAAEQQPVTRGNGSGPYGPLLAYATTKAALNRMTNALAAELEGSNIAVVALDPGLVRTENSEEFLLEAGVDPAIAGSPIATARLIAELVDRGMTHTGEIIHALDGGIALAG